MTPLIRLALAMFRADARAFLRGAALGITVLAMGALLLGLSGWFVTASAAAGIAGIGIGFDFFRPSAGVRFLALGRAAARYGERMLTHDATLRALAALRGRIYAAITRLPWESQARLRGAEALNRLTADVDALDGVLLRLVLPMLSACIVGVAAFGMLWALVGIAVAAGVTVGLLAGGGIALVLTARGARTLAAAEEDALQDLRARSFDLAANRADLAVAGALAHQGTELARAITRAGATRDRLEAVDRRGGLALSLATGIAAAVALAVGGTLAAKGTITPAVAAIGFFAALALGEGIALLRRGLAELGRMESAGARVETLCATPPRPEAATEPDPDPAAPLIAARGVAHHRPGAARATFAPVDLTLARGETVVITGASGAGKSTLLAVLAGLEPATAGRVRLMGHDLADWPEAALRDRLTMVPQRAALIGGTVRENLALARDGLTDAQAQDVVTALALAPALGARDGLDTRLGPGGTGLSGGQARRLCLARAALRAPAVLLLDEPSEGLDPATAAAVLTGLRGLLPDSGIIIVSHRPADRAHATRVIDLSR